MTRTTIQVFVLRAEEKTVLELPEGARVLDVQMAPVVSRIGLAQVQELPCLWAEVDPDAPIIKRTFRLLGTGKPYQELEKLVYIRTFQHTALDQGGVRAYTFHCYEEV